MSSVMEQLLKEESEEEKAALAAEQAATEEPEQEASEEATESPQETASEAAGEEISSDPAPDPEEKPEPSVPTYRLREETERRRALEAKIAKMEERYQHLTERLSQETKKEPDPPSYEDDPGGHLLHRLNQSEEKLRRFEEFDQQQQVASHQNQEVVAVAQRLSADEQSFAKERPDYFEAAQYLRDSRIRELQTLGVDPATADRMVTEEAISFAYQAQQQGVSGPERFYELAKLRGYTGKKVEPEKEIQKQKQQRQRAASLGPSGASPKNSLSLAEVADLPDDEFDKLMENGGWAKLWQ